MTTDTACKICGTEGHNCVGSSMVDSRQIITSDGAQKVRGPLRLPRQINTLGRAGYIGPVETYDRKHPTVRLVQHNDDEDIDLEAEAPLEPAHEAQAPEAGNAASEAPEAATAAPGPEERAGTKSRKPAPDDKSRKGGTGTK